MPLYDYLAVDQAGRRVRGALEAESARAARTMLRAKDLFPLQVGAESDQAGLGRAGWGRVSTKELAGAMRQMAFLVGAGLPVVEALSAVVEQTGLTRLGRHLSRVKDEVVAGQSLAQAMALSPRVFPELAVNMVRAGEAAGALEVVLDRLAELLESRVKLTSRIRAALAYPLFLVLVGGLVLSFLFSYVIPTVVGMFNQTGQILPWPTRVLLGLIQAGKAYGWLAGLLLAGLILGLISFRRNRAGRRWLDGLKLRIPVIGSVNRKVILARFTRTMVTLLKSGVNVVDSLAITSKVTDNLLYRESLETAKERIEQGGHLAGELAKSPLFPPLVVHLVAAGERSATLDKVFDRLATGLEEEVESSLTGLLSLLEPVLILIMGAIVGFIVVSILLPIFDMTNLVR